MAMMVHSTLTKTPELEPQYQMQFSVTPLGKDLPDYTEDAEQRNCMKIPAKIETPMFICH